jgi:tetratricopeptide (TPR) repeat protein
MNFIKDNMNMNEAIKLLEDNISVNNEVVIARGYNWLFNNIFVPTLAIENTNYKDSLLGLLIGAYDILGDVSFILKGYEAANYWYRKYYLYNTNDKEVLHDIAFTYEMSGDYMNAQKYYRLYFDNDSYQLDKFVDQHPVLLQQAYSKLVQFQSDWVINQCSCNIDCHELYRIVTIAYSTFGQASLVDVLARIEEYFTSSSNPSIDYVDLFYAVDYFVEIPLLWKLIFKYKPSIDIIDSDFNLYSSTDRGYDNSIIEDIIQLHIFRTENDINSMTTLQEKNKLWQSPRICIEFYQIYNRMPNWYEMYERGLITYNP